MAYFSEMVYNKGKKNRKLAMEVSEMTISERIAQMTLEEKCSLLSGADFWHTKAIDRLGIHSLMVSDGPHGLRKQDVDNDATNENDSIRAVCFPTGCATAASFDRALLRELGEAIGDSAQHERLAVVLGPAINIKRSPLCGRNFEYFSEDPYLAGEAAASFSQGVQSRGVSVSVKHFAGNSQEHRRMSSDSRIDERTLREIYLSAFETVVKRTHPWTVMCSYNRLNGAYACENRWLLTELLRGEWGFDGCVISDWGATADRIACVEAGMDLEMPTSGGENDRRVAQAVRDGRLDEKLVDLCCERVLTLLERYESNAKPETAWNLEAQHRLARRLAADCIVLLKNDGNVLPLRRDAKLAIIGAFAKKPRYQGGGSSHINSFTVTSAWDELGALANASYADGYAGDEPDEALLAEAVETARRAETAVLSVGLPDSFESEGYDRKHMRMPRCQTELIERVAAVNPNVVVVLHNGSPIEMPWIDSVKGVLELYLGGQAVGGAAVDVLFGDVNPSGRLPETFPLKLEDNPSFPWYGGEGDVAEYREGVFVGYRWYDKRKMDVLFPFGYGLSYTTFEYSNLKLDAKEIKDTDTLSVTVDVKNTGKVAGKEVVQLYVGDVTSTVFRPVRELKGFQKVALAPGEVKTLTFKLCKRAFAYWNEQIHDWHVESGAFTIEIGHSSRDIALSDVVNVQSTVELPETFTMDSIFLDLMANAKARTVLKPLLDAMTQTLGGSPDDSDVATSAISPDMMQAMMQYMPIRNLLSFAPGSMTFEQLQALLDKLNQR